MLEAVLLTKIIQGHQLVIYCQKRLDDRYIYKKRGSAESQPLLTLNLIP